MKEFVVASIKVQKEIMSIVHNTNDMYFNTLTHTILCCDNDLCNDVYNNLKNINIDCKIDDTCHNRINIMDKSVGVSVEIVRDDTRKLTISKHCKQKYLKEI